MCEQVGLSYMKEVEASNGPIRMFERLGAVSCSAPAQSSPSRDAPVRLSSSAPVLRGSRRDPPSSREQSRRFQARSSPDSPASLRLPFQRSLAVSFHPLPPL